MMKNKVVMTILMILLAPASVWSQSTAAAGDAEEPPSAGAPLLTSEAEQPSHRRFGLHFAMGTRFFIGHATPKSKLVAIGDKGYTLLDMELGFHYFVSKNLGVGLDLRPDIAVGDGLFLGMIPGITYEGEMWYFRAGVHLNVLPIVTLGVIAGAGAQFKINDWLHYFIGLDVPIWFLNRGEANVAFQLSVLTGPKVRF